MFIVILTLLRRSMFVQNNCRLLLISALIGVRRLLLILLFILVLFLYQILLIMNMKNDFLPRGYRNNNPCNIRHSADHFVGEVSNASRTDSSFKQFSEMKYGFRAFYKLVKTYNVKYEKRTLKSFIGRFAPPFENNTLSYIKVVCGRTGFTPDTILSCDDAVQMVDLACAMAYVENGQECNRDDAWLGYIEFLK